MHDSDHEDFLDDDKIEMSDLDTPDEHKKSIFLYQIAQLAQKIHLSPRTRIRIFALTLLLGGVIFTYLFTSYLHIPLLQTTHIPTPTPTSKTSSGLVAGGDIMVITDAPPGNIPVVNGIAYISTSDGLLSARQASNGTLIWQTKTSVPLSQPSVANNTIYITSLNSQGSHVDAFQANNGTILWSYQMQQPIFGGIQVGEGVIYISTQNKNIYTLQANNGKLLWHFTVGSTLPLEVSLVSAEGVTAIRTNNSTVVLLRTIDGAQLWHYATADLGSGLWQPYIQGGIAYIQASNSTIQARKLNNGQPLWHYSADNGNNLSYTMQAGVIYMHIENKAFLALREQDGTLIWQFKTDDMISNWDIQSNSLIAELVDGSLRVFRAQDGSPLWQFNVSVNHGSVFPFLYSQDKIFYATTGTSEVTIYTRQIKDGKVLWHHLLNNSDGIILQVSNDTIYTQQTDGSIDAWSSHTGIFLWHYRSSIPIFGNITEIDGQVYLQQQDGKSIVLQAKNGKVAWHT